jgi:hypothetical protein
MDIYFAFLPAHKILDRERSKSKIVVSKCMTYYASVQSMGHNGSKWDQWDNNSNTPATGTSK